MGRRSKSSRLSLWMNGIPVGTWEVDSTGKHQLTYDQSWLGLEQGRPVSLSMPLRPAARYSGDVVRNFFGGSPEQVVNALLEEHRPSAAELDRLAEMIAKARREDGR